jgi:hypothetical protein
MAIYRYALRNECGPNEHLGFIEIHNDSEAIEFGHNVIVGIMREPDPALGRVTLEITEGLRQVDSVPLEPELRRKAYS